MTLTDYCQALALWTAFVIGFASVGAALWWAIDETSREDQQ